MYIVFLRYIPVKIDLNSTTRISTEMINALQLITCHLYIADEKVKKLTVEVENANELLEVTKKRGKYIITIYPQCFSSSHNAGFRIRFWKPVKFCITNSSTVRRGK